MKLFSLKSTVFLGVAICLAGTFAQEDVEVDIDEEVIEDEVDSEANEEANAELEKERTTGVVDTTLYPGRVISRKKVVSKHPAAGQPLEVEYTIWNVGNTEVLDVEVIDDSYTTEDYTEAQKVQIKTESIAPGKSYSETHTVVPKESKTIKLIPAKVSYKSQTSKSNEELIQYNSEGATEGAIEIATAAHYARKVANHTFDWLCFLLISMPTTVIPYMNANNLVIRYTGKAKSA